MKKMILVNGNFLCRSLTGIERFAFEILNRLDEQLSDDDDVAVFTPLNANQVPAYKKIRIIKSEKPLTSFPKWDIFTFKRACKKYNAVGLNFSNTAPLGKTCGISFIHDIYAQVFPEDFKGLKKQLIRLYSILHYRNIAKNALHVLTVSNFSRSQIQNAYNVPESRISVIPNGWDHFKTIEQDDSIFDTHPQLKAGNYYFTLGSLQKRKNLQWIAEYAEKHQDSLFAISGKVVSGYASQAIRQLQEMKNVVLLGYVSDQQVKSLMHNCKAFVFPSLYEGFGIPPLEALSCGAKIIVSDAASLPEIYKDTAYYINPNDTQVNLDSILEKNTPSPEHVLSEYTYERSAQKLLSCCKQVLNTL